MPELSLQTHKFDKVSKLPTEVNPYRMHAINGVKYFEHPVNSGNLWYEDLKTPAGRIVAGKVDKEAKHTEYVPPLADGERTIRELELLKKQNDELKRELEALARERQARELSQKAAKAEGKADAGLRNAGTNDTK